MDGAVFKGQKEREKKGVIPVLEKKGWAKDHGLRVIAYNAMIETQLRVCLCTKIEPSPS